LLPALRLSPATWELFLLGILVKQKYYSYDKWEDYVNGMWRKVPLSEESKYLDEAIRFTGNAEEYGSYMLLVAKEWPISCEHNLTDISQNRKAWIGHAACCLAIKCPEYITRQAWGYLTKQQQDEANNKADIAISWWEENKCEDYDAQNIFEY
jgi:hypothetical protein